MADQFIVAEISKSWINGEPADPSRPLLCRQFEIVIAVNLERGYRLHSFQLSQCMTASPTLRHEHYDTDQLIETIIAVFERTP